MQLLREQIHFVITKKKKRTFFCWPFLFFLSIFASCLAPEVPKNSERNDSISSRTPVVTTHDHQLIFADPFDIDGLNITINWLPIVSVKNLANHRIKLYPDASCTLGENDFGLTGSTYNINNSLIFGLPDGVYYGRVNAIDSDGNEFTGPCSDDSIILDSTAPVDNTANLQFTFLVDNDGNDIAVTWTAFSDLYLDDHILTTYTDAACSVGEVNHGRTSSSSNGDAIVIDGLADGVYYATVLAIDVHGFATVSSCSTDSIVVDSVSPVDNTATALFTDNSDSDGNDIAVTWTAFSDANLLNHQIFTYTDAACTLGEINHGATGSSTNSNSTIVDGLTAGTYYMKIVALDIAGNSTTSACSADSILIDLSAPVDNAANLQFSAASVTVGNDVSVSWTAFSDTDLSNHKLYTYTNSSCASGEVDHGFTGNSTNADAAIIDGLGDGRYYAIVEAYDLANNKTTSACSSDFILVDNNSPVDNTANLQFTNAADSDGNSIAVTWTAFSDANLADHQVSTFTEGTCTTPSGVAHGLSGSTVNAASLSGLGDGSYFAKVAAHDSVGNITTSACSTDSIIVDTISPSDNTANLQFTDAFDNDGNLLALTWTAFSDTNLTNYRLYTYTDAACSVGEINHGLTGNSSTTNSLIVTGLAEGTYYGKVAAVDIVGHETNSACSSDSIVVDKTAPVDNTANLIFVDASDLDGNDLSVSWTAFSDATLADYGLRTYTNSLCTTGEVDHGKIGSTAVANASIVDGVVEGTIYAKVEAFDNAGNATLSACSSDFIIVDFLSPVDNIATFTFDNPSNASGSNISTSWVAFSDVNLSDHRIYASVNADCSASIDTGLTGSSNNSANISSLPDGTYYGRVKAIDLTGKETLSACSVDTIIVDTTLPVDNTANVQFSAAISSDGLNLAVTWTAFSDSHLTDHEVRTYTDPACSSGETIHTLTGSTSNAATISLAAVVGTYYAKVRAIDIAGNSQTSACSSDSILIDSDVPVDNTANIQFTAPADNLGDNIAVSWTPFSDANLANHQLYTSLLSDCSAPTDHGLTGTTSNNNSSIIDGLADGTYYAQVKAIDAVGNETLSACGSDTIIVDKVLPVDNTANLQFTDSFDTDGNDLAITWTAFSDSNLSDHGLKTYTDAACTIGETDHGKTSAATNSNASIVDGLSDGKYYATVSAYDVAGNAVTSACSTDFIIVDKTLPSAGSPISFTTDTDSDGNNLALTWNAFSDTNLSDHGLKTFTDSACSSGETDHGLTGSTTNSNNTLVDGLADASYWATVTAIDAAGNSSTASCSTDFIIVDSSAPVDNTADLQFSNLTDADGDNLEVTWTAFSDLSLSNHRLKTYTDSACTLNEVDHGLTGTTTNSDNTIINGLGPATYFAKVSALDALGRETLSACSTDSITVATNVPLSFDFSSYDYGTPGVTTSKTFTLTNNGNTTSGTITTSFNDAGTAAAWNTITDNCHGNTLAVDANCTIVVDFQPTTLAASTYTAILEITAAPGSTELINLTGTK